MYTEKDRITLTLLCFTSNDSQKSMKILIDLNTSNYFNIAVADLKLLFMHKNFDFFETSLRSHRNQ